MSKKVEPKAVSYEPQRRLSPWRVMLGLIIVAGVIAGSFFGGREWHSMRAVAAVSPWFAPYVDVTATPTFPFENMGSTSRRDAVLSFIVAQPSDACTPSWGGAYTMDKASAALDLDRRIARLNQQGGNVAISFGGLRNQELAVSCRDDAALLQAYRSVVDRYKINTIDLDLERDGLTNTDAGERRAVAISRLQAERRSKGKPLAVWVTLPVTPNGLSKDGTAAIEQLLKGKVDLAGINVMTMDYGAHFPKGESMLAASKSALNHTQRQLSILYQRAGIQLSDRTVWSKIGATPMIGQNDDAGQIFTLDNAKGLNQFALDRNIGRMSMWSANRDTPCSDNYVDVTTVSDSCSGVTAGKNSFMIALGKGFKGNLSLSAGKKTTSEPAAKQQRKDDPATSPYAIWSASNAYLQGTKVVWHRNVYEAKWWTQGDTPDNPVLDAGETPWELVGPVLPGEKPIPQATLPAGTYPDWDGTITFNTGERVLFNGVPYQAKWWNQGQSPAAASSKPDSSAWTPLTQAQINAIEAERNAASQ